MNHSFDVDIAVKYGVNAAILLENIAFWCEHNRANGRHFHDGYYWTYNSVSAFQELFPYMGLRQIRTAISKLIDAGLLIKGEYNEDARDRTGWYAVTQNVSLHLSKRQSADDQNDEPLPDINTHISHDDEYTRAREEVDTSNPYGDGDYRADLDTVEQYALQNLKYMGERAIQEFQSFSDDLPDDVIRHGIDNALDANKRTWNYVKAILNSYVEDDVKSIEDAVETDKKQAARYKHTPPPMKPRAMRGRVDDEKPKLWNANYV